MARRKKIVEEIPEPIVEEPVSVPEEWMTVVRFTVCDYDEASGRYVDSMSLFELQQEQGTMRLRTVKAE